MRNNKIRRILLFGMILSIFPLGNAYCQRLERRFSFDSLYNIGLQKINSDISISRQYLKELESNLNQLTPVQKAKTNYLRLRAIYASKDEVIALENRMLTPPRPLSYNDSLIYSARKYLEKSMPDKAIHLLMEALDSLTQSSEKAEYCRINLCEAYRQKQEYKKGVEMLNEILFSKREQSALNKAFAYNRLAALYNEWGNMAFNTADSVIKYSELCISLSEKINSKGNLALSQNELSVQLMRKKQYDRALELSIKSVKNFKEAGMFYSAMNALINQSNLYIEINRTGSAFQVIEDATNLCKIEENRNLFMRVYLQFARVYTLSGNYKEAYEFLAISNQLLNDFFYDRINSQINEQSARYDLFTKEQKIREEKQKNEFHKKQLTFLIILLIFLSIAFILSFFYFKLRRKEFTKQKLIEAVIENEASERKRIARDLHDEIGPLLSAINHYFQAYIDAGEDDKKGIQTKLHQVISGAIDEVSRISHNISPYVLENYGLNTALNDFIAPLKNGNRIKVDFTSDFSERFELNKELTVYRCITELFNNTMRHADATIVSLEVTCRNKVLCVFYTDNGKGFDMNLAKTEGMGLNNIRNRVETFGGKLVIESSLKNGIKVSIEIPVHYE